MAGHKFKTVTFMGREYQVKSPCESKQNRQIHAETKLSESHGTSRQIQIILPREALQGNLEISLSFR
jgi:hypothetical protein